jgi:hypothetical protein
MANFMRAIALPRRASAQTIYWVCDELNNLCDELNNCGFGLPVACLEKPMLTSVQNSAESARLQTFQKWNLLRPKIMELRMLALRRNVIDIADRQIRLLSPAVALCLTSGLPTLYQKVPSQNGNLLLGGVMLPFVSHTLSRLSSRKNAFFVSS